MKILIAEDQEDSRIYLEKLLKSQGYEVVSATDGVEAMSLAHQVSPDLVISDALMPRMDGFELCRQMKADPEFKTLPFIFYTATYIEERDKELSMALGAARYLVKPMEPAALLETVHQVMAESREGVISPITDEQAQVEILEQHRDALARKLEKKVVQLEEEKSALRESEAKFRRLVESLENDYFFYSHDVEGVITYISPSIRNVLGYEPSEFIGHYAEYLTDHPVNQEVEKYTQLAIRGDKQPPYELEIYHKDGMPYWLEVSEFPVFGESGQVIAVEGIAHDITEQKCSHEAIAELAHRNALILESAGEGIFGLSTDGKNTFVNPAAANMLGYEPSELIGLPSHGMWHHSRPDGTDFPLEECPITATLTNGESNSGEEWFIRKDGNFFPVEYTSSPIVENGVITGAVVAFSDISEKKEAEEKINHLAYYDALTDLPNRALLIERLTQALTMGRRHQHNAALMLINIDRFKNINDALGHTLGDSLLKALSQRLVTQLHAGDTLSRLASDEFAILLPEVGEQPEQASLYAHRMAETILDCVRLPISINDEEFSITASLGITLFPEVPEEDAVTILRRADTALHRAKASGGNHCSFFETNMGESVEQRFHIERELRNAIVNEELRLFLQPQVDHQGQLAGFEALVRWQHPVRGLIPPGVFIPVAEESDLIIDLGDWVFREALNMMVKGDMHGHPFHLSVNLSPRQFRQENFVSGFKSMLAATGADPNHLTLEVTESLLIENITEIVAKMSELATMGIHFSIDDFGTGYSSLAYLKRLPLDELKIDRSFIQDAPVDKEDAALVETILAVAKHMHLKVVAEGVETEEQAAFLKERGKMIYQGYLYGKPEPATVCFERWFGSDLS